MQDPTQSLANSEYGNITDSELAQAIEEVARSLSSIMIRRKVNQVVMLGGMQTFLMALSASGRGDNEEAGEKLKQMSDYFLQTGVFAPRPVEFLPPIAISKRSVKH